MRRTTRKVAARATDKKQTDKETGRDERGERAGGDRHDTCIYGPNKMSYVAFGFFGSSRK